MSRRVWVQIAVATLSGNSLRQTVHTHRASVHQAAKLVAALLTVARVTAGLVESNGSLPPGLWLTSPAGWLPRTGISSGTLCSVIKYGLPLPFNNKATFTFYLHDAMLAGIIAAAPSVCLHVSHILVSRVGKPVAAGISNLAFHSTYLWQKNINLFLENS